jgi:hypothetical protein
VKPWWLGVLLLCWSCDKAELATDGKPGEAGAAKKSSEALTTEYKAMKPPARLEAARSACFIGDACAGHEAEALMAAADSDAERDELRKVARTALSGQYQTKLAGKAKKPVSVETTGAGTTLFVKGICNRFLIEDFMGGPEKRQAKALGFSRVECSDAAVTAAADL